MGESKIGRLEEVIKASSIYHPKIHPQG